LYVLVCLPTSPVNEEEEEEEDDDDDDDSDFGNYIIVVLK